MYPIFDTNTLHHFHYLHVRFERKELFLQEKMRAFLSKMGIFLRVKKGGGLILQGRDDFILFIQVTLN